CFAVLRAVTRVSMGVTGPAILTAFWSSKRTHFRLRRGRAASRFSSTILRGAPMKRLLLYTIAACIAVAGAALAQTGDRPATIIVRAPADATLTIGGQPTDQRGVQRRFETPALAPGRTYSYEIEARWTQNGREMVVLSKVEFTPGQTATVDLTGRGVAATPATSPKVEPRIDETEPKTGAKIPAKVIAPAPKAVAQPDGSKAVRLPIKSRTFLFTYGGTVKDLKPGEEARIWLPVPVSTSEQTIAIEKKELPGKDRIGKETQYGNTILFVEGKADAKGEMPFKITYKVTRQEVKTDVKANLVLKPKEPEGKLARFLQPDAKVPITGKPLELLAENLKDKKLPNEQFAAA